MLKAFREFADRIADRYDEAATCLDQDDYTGAMDILTQLSTSHAKTTLSLRNLLVREGIIGDDS